jgi:hypothetical protein
MDEKKMVKVLTRDQLNKEKNRVKELFMPKTGSNIAFPNGAVFKVAFSNIGQLRFTAMFDHVVKPEDEVKRPPTVQEEQEVVSHG